MSVKFHRATRADLAQRLCSARRYAGDPLRGLVVVPDGLACLDDRDGDDGETPGGRKADCQRADTSRRALFGIHGGGKWAIETMHQLLFFAAITSQSGIFANQTPYEWRTSVIWVVLRRQGGLWPDGSATPRRSRGKLSGAPSLSQ